MKIRLTILISCLIILTVNCCKGNNTDTLIIYDDYDHVKMKMSLDDYLSEVNSSFNDSLKYNINNFFKDSIASIKKRHHGSILIERNYYVNLYYYDRFSHPKKFDTVLFTLLKKNKLIIIKDGVSYRIADLKIKVIPVYRLETLYCGKDWCVFYKDNLLTGFEKTRNSKAYRTIDAF